MMILVVILIEILLFMIAMGLWVYAENKGSAIAGLIGLALIFVLIAVPILFGNLHGYIEYKPSNDKDLARITAVTQEQDLFRTYYKVEVEYLTNTPKQEGVVTNNRIETDTFYCYYENEELVKKLKDNQYKELWIISGYKGGYETYKDFGTKLIKDIELKDE